DELRAHGHQFRTGSDSEVLAHAYDAWDLDFLDRLDGMFAFALWDEARGRLVLARDRLGEKPLYHAAAGGLLLFASELSALRSHPACPDTLDPMALSAYLALEYVPAPRTMLEGVEKLEPATALILENGAVRCHRYWSLVPRSSRTDYRTAVAELRTHLADAVRSRLVSDVPAGVFLSGGLDSSVVAALAAREGRVETFSIGFTEASFDESSYARDVAKHIGSQHHEHILRADDMVGLVPRLPEMLDEPLGDASILPTHVLSRFARERVTVALGGDGGDELFAGYPMHQAQRIAPLLRQLPGPAHALMRGALDLLPASARNFSFGFKARTLLSGSAYGPPENHARWMASFSPEWQQQLLTPEIRRLGGDGAGAFTAIEAAWQRTTGWPMLGRVSLLDLYTYLPNDILTKVDRASMAVALEVRAPFLARDVVEFAAALPDQYRMRALQGKRILRDAARDLLPERILRRRKKGFGIPVAAWLRTSLRPLLLEVLSPGPLRDAGLFRPQFVEHLVREHLSGRRDHRKPLWTLLVFELWRRHAGTPRLPPPAPASVPARARRG
ncbi:MAG: asparagine synthase (glutamine-hydrolyzing), partial [Longimicrobiales bacterium]